jgi:hypothetical protein
VRGGRAQSSRFGPHNGLGLEGAPIMAGMVASRFSEPGTGGWAWILSDMKSLLETGSSMYAGSQ